MEIVQEIGAYAGLAAILGLALLSALYFSQARDVKRLREWAGRAPERPPQEAVPRRVVAQPVPKPGGQLPARPAPPPVPRPPGAQAVTGATPAVASATGAAPAVATGPAMATPAAKAVQAEGSREADEGGGVVAGDASAEAAAAEAATAGGESAVENGGAAAENGTGAVDVPSEQAGDRSDEEASSGVEPTGDQSGEIGESGEPSGDELEEAATDGEGEAGPEGEAAPEGGTGERPAVRQETEEWDPVETGEWRPEDEHSDYELLPGQDPEPTPLPTVRPPVPPRPYGGPRTASPATAAGRGERSEQGRILPDYADVRPAAENGRRRRRPLLVAGGAVGVVVVVLAALQLTGGDEEPAPTSTPVGEQRQAGSGGGGGSPAPRIDPATVTVAVLNGTTVPGLARTIGDKIAAEGFQRGTVTNSFDQERAESVVLYAPDAEREAEVVGRRLDIAQREPIDPGSQELAGDATVVVVAGADQAQ